MIIFLKIGLLAMIGCLIGWITNKVAIRMLFRPHNPKKILFFTFHGVLPKRQKEISKSIGDTVANEFLSISDIIDETVGDIDITDIKQKIKRKVHEVVKAKVPPMFLAMAGDTISKIIDDYIDSQGDELFNELIDDVKQRAVENVDISKMIEDNINKLDFSEFEELIVSITKKELQHIEYIGAILGLLIGLIQGILVHIM